MSSLSRNFAQIPSLYGYFRGENPSADVYTKFILAPIKFTIGVGGVVGIQGSNIYFSSYQSVVSFLGDPVSYGNNSVLIADGQLFRDMGKTYTLYVQTTINNAYANNLKSSVHVATLTKVQKYLDPGQVSEGATGITTSTASPPAAGSAYNTGYVVTWTANPAVYNPGDLPNSGVPVSVVRVGYE